MLEDRSSGEGLLQGLESCTRRDRPSKLDSFFGEGSEGIGQVGIVVNEFPVEVCESDEGLHFFDRGRDRPVQDKFDLSRIHAYAGWRHRIADKGHLLLMKLTLLHLCIEFVLFPS